MSMINYKDPIIISWNVDDNGSRVSVPVYNEQIQIINGKASIDGIPDEQYRVVINGFVEINIKDKITEQNQFKVDYLHSYIYFNPSIGEISLTVSRYYSRGIWRIPASKIYTKIDDLGNVVSTLADIEGDLGEIASQIDAINAIAENASGIATSLETNIATGTALNTNLQTSISTATTKKTQLDGSISTSTTSKSSLDTSIASANTSKSSLDTSIGNATTSKSNLDSSISSGNTLKTNLDGSISTGTTLKNDLDANITTGNQLKVDLPPLVSDAGTAKTNLDGSITTSITKKSDLDGSISSATTKKSELDNSISSANTINNTLSNSSTGTIKKATDINTTLNASISTANTSKSNLDTSVGVANTSKINLDGSVTTANTAKSDLDTSISTASTTKSDLDTSIGSANTINNTLSNPTTGNIKKATDINTTLSGNISTATTKNSDLQTTITNANTSKSNLDASIGNSTTAKGNLDGSISTANTTKTGLDGSITQGNALKSELDDIISGTDYEQVIIDVNNIKQDQHNHANKTILDGLSDDSGNLKYNGQDVGVGDMEKNIYDTDGDGKVDIANNSEKLGGQLPNYYAKQSDVNNKVDKVSGKQLSTEDYTTLEKNKLVSIESNATKNDTDTNLKARANHTGTQTASTISDFANAVRSTVLTGLSTASNTVVIATDTILSALGKLQKQISDNLASLTSHTSNKSNPHVVTKAQIGGLTNVEDKSSATIRSEITSSNVTTAIGYTPANATNEHTHINKTTLDKFTEVSGEVLYNNQPISGGVSNWIDLEGKPTSLVEDIDNAVELKHSHPNKAITDNFGYSNGELYYGEVPLTFLPSEGGGDVLVHRYVHTSNKVIQPTGLDKSTGLFTTTEPINLPAGTKRQVITAFNYQMNNILPREWNGVDAHFVEVVDSYSFYILQGSASGARMTYTNASNTNVDVNAFRFEYDFSGNQVIDLSNLNIKNGRFRIKGTRHRPGWTYVYLDMVHDDGSYRHSYGTFADGRDYLSLDISGLFSVEGNFVSARIDNYIKSEWNQSNGTWTYSQGNNGNVLAGYFDNANFSTLTFSPAITNGSVIEVYDIQPSLNVGGGAIPTKTSELENDSGFITSSAIPTSLPANGGNADTVGGFTVGVSVPANAKFTDTIPDTSSLMPISGGILENYREKLVTLSGTSTAINLSLANVFTHSLSGNTTYSISNAVSGQAHSFTLIITQTATVRTITFPASVKWQDGEMPDLSTVNKTYILTFLTVDGGTTWLGMFGGEF